LPLTGPKDGELDLKEAAWTKAQTKGRIPSMTPLYSAAYMLLQ